MEKSKAFSRMSLGNAIFTVLFFTTSTAGNESYAVQTAHELADVAPIHWEKRRLTWAIMNAPQHVPKATIVSAMEYAGKKWAEKTPFTFRQVPPHARPDIQITMTPPQSRIYNRTYDASAPIMDYTGRQVEFIDSAAVWSDMRSPMWCNFKFIALHELGHVLGMGCSEEPTAVMYCGNDNPALKSRHDPVITPDDERGIQTKYGDRNGNFPYGEESLGGGRGEFGI